MKNLIRTILLLGAGVLSAENSLEDFLAEPALKTASVGFALIPLNHEQSEEPNANEEESEKTITKELTHNPHLALTPASVQKVITTATALQILGPDYTFVTELYQVGDDLIIKGGGDPLLATSSLNAEFPTWHQALLDAGLNEITGSLIADPSFFEDRTTPNQWLWGDIGNYYGAGPSGLNFHRNSYQITFRPGSVGSAAKLLSTYPKPPGVRFENLMKTGSNGSGDQGYAYAGPRRRLVTFRGTVPAGGKFTIKGALPNPPLSCLHAFRDYLKKKEFSVEEMAVERGVSLAEGKRIYQGHSPSLAKILVPTNQKSVNLNADCLFKALTPQGTTLGAQTKMNAHWKEQGVDLDGFLAHDGSGLSPQNTVTAHQVAHILRLTSDSEHGATFRKSLPVAGRSGTLRSFGRGTILEGRLFAKTGSMERVRAWAGYLITRSQERYAFALLINHYHGSDAAVRSATARFLERLCKQ